MSDEVPSKNRLVANKNRVDRIVAIDFGRGFAMFIVLLTHAVNYWAWLLIDTGGPGAPKAASNSAEASIDPSMWLEFLIFPFRLLGSWASIFALLTGASTAYTMFYHIHHKGVKIKKRLLESFTAGVILLVIHFIYTYFFTYPTFNIHGEFARGLVPASVYAQKWIIPPWSFLFVAGPLSMIAFSDFFVVLVCSLLWRNGGHSEDNIVRNKIVFIILGAIFVLGAEFIKGALIPTLYETFNSGNYVAAMVLTFLVGSKHCIFPFVGYAFFGSVFGWQLTEVPLNRWHMQRLGYSLAAIFLSIAIIDAILNGVPPLVGLYHPFFLYMLNLGLQVYIATLCVSNMDYIPLNERKNYGRYYKIVPFRRLSLISLSLFFMEQTVGALYTMLMYLIFPIYMTNMLFIVFVYAPIYIWAWFEFIAWWEKRNFRFSFEWCLLCLLKRKNIFSKEDLLSVEKFIYQSCGFETREDYYRLKKERKPKYQ